LIIPISYPLTTKTPLYPNTPVPIIHTLRSTENGDSANTGAITFSTHSGTHIDAPFHFCNEGKTIAGCLTLDNTFFPAYCIEVCKPKGEEISVSDLKNRISDVQDAEALLIHTGWDAIRSKDPQRYSQDHPWVSSEVPHFLREKCPKLRLFGIDQVSISSVLHRDAGHECHRKFLCGKRPILILEDLNLSDIGVNGRFQLHVYPYMIDEVDGIPVIAIVETEQGNLY
jgi:kynurenine formamidase